MVFPPHVHCNISGGIWLLFLFWLPISRFTLKPAFAVCHIAQRPDILCSSSVQEAWLWISGFIHLSFGARSDLSDTMPISWSSFLVLHCVPTIGYAGLVQTSCDFSAIRFDYVSPLMIFDDGFSTVFNSAHSTGMRLSHPVSKYLSGLTCATLNPPSRQEIMGNHFFHHVLYGCPLLVPAFGSTPSTLTRRRLNGLQHPLLFFRL